MSGMAWRALGPNLRLNSGDSNGAQALACPPLRTRERLTRPPKDSSDARQRASSARSFGDFSLRGQEFKRFFLANFHLEGRGEPALLVERLQALGRDALLASGLLDAGGDVRARGFEAFLRGHGLEQQRLAHLALRVGTPRDAPLVHPLVQLLVRHHRTELVVRVREPPREPAIDEPGRNLERRALDQRVEQRAAQRLLRAPLAPLRERLAQARAQRLERLDAGLPEL